MWNEQLYQKEWAKTASGRRLRGVNDEEDTDSFFVDWMQEEDKVWEYLGTQLGEALLGEVPLSLCDPSECSARPKFLLQSHRLLGSAKFELRRIESVASKDENSVCCLKSEAMLISCEA